MHRDIPAAAYALIRYHEGCRLEAYDDRRPNVRLRPGDKPVGTLTIGIGHTGPDVYIGQVITEAEAERLFRQDIDETEGLVERLVSVPVSDNQFGALVSLAFNIGGAAFGSSTVLKRLNARDYKGAAKAFALWNKATDKRTGKKVVLDGLVARRAAEARLFETPDSVAPVTMPKPSPGKATDTPAELVQGKPTVEQVGKIGAAVGTGAAGVGTAAGAPWQVIVILVVLAVAAAVGGVIVGKRKGWLA